MTKKVSTRGGLLLVLAMTTTLACESAEERAKRDYARIRDRAGPTLAKVAPQISEALGQIATRDASSPFQAMEALIDQCNHVAADLAPLKRMSTNDFQDKRARAHAEWLARKAEMFRTQTQACSGTIDCASSCGQNLSSLGRTIDDVADDAARYAIDLPRVTRSLPSLTE